MLRCVASTRRLWQRMAMVRIGKRRIIYNLRECASRARTKHAARPPWIVRRHRAGDLLTPFGLCRTAREKAPALSLAQTNEDAARQAASVAFVRVRRRSTSTSVAPASHLLPSLRNTQHTVSASVASNFTVTSARCAFAAAATQHSLYIHTQSSGARALLNIGQHIGEHRVVHARVALCVCVCVCVRDIFTVSLWRCAPVLATTTPCAANTNAIINLTSAASTTTSRSVRRTVQPQTTKKPTAT